jgi:NAD(P)H-hydrate repair Nnr-like enzyme with NAD(P)H-hydrate epimerase domain
VSALLFGRILDTTGDARTNFEALASLAASSESIAGSIGFCECGAGDDALRIAQEHFARPLDVIVDGLFGTGLTRPLEGVYAALVGQVNKFRTSATSSPLAVAIDVPSGLNSDNAEIVGRR